MRILFTLALALILGAPLYAQRGGGGMNPDDSFNRLLSGYGGTGDIVDYSRVGPEARERYNRFAQMTNTEPMPLSGTITRAQYAEAFTKRMEAMRPGGGGPMGGGMTRGGERGGERGGPPQAGGERGGYTPGAAATAPSVTMTMGSQPMQPQPERPVSDEDVAKTMCKYDRNDDGRISVEEGERTDKLRTVFSHYDANRDGSIDMAELKVYRLDSENRRVPEPPNTQQNSQQPQQSWQQPQNSYGYDQGRREEGRREGRDSITPTEEPKPVVYRFGKLPMKDLPSWFESLDTDKDGQIGLYEWRTGKKITSEFVTMDLNSDGLLTAEEYLRWKKVPTTTATSTSSPSAMTTLSGKDSRESSKESRESSKDSKKEDRGEKGGSNPFRRK